ncbi:hypothetical protein ACFX1Z_036657 [Malus domestica]
MRSSVPMKPNVMRKSNGKNYDDWMPAHRTKPIDGRGEISSSESRFESLAPSIISRRSVYEPLQTGLIAIDSMIPIGRGQKASYVAQVVTALQERGAMEYTIVVVKKRKGK